MSDNVKWIQQFQNSQNISQSWQAGTSQTQSFEKPIPANSDAGSFCLESNQEISSTVADSTPSKLKGHMEDLDDDSLEEMMTPQLSICKPKKDIKLEKAD